MSEEVENRTRVFEGVVGNAAALRLLARDLESGVSHAYLFHGPPGVGKHTVAHRLGAALVAGENGSALQRALKDLHPDLTEVEPEGALTTISQIREVVRLASSRPFEGERRVIVLHADTLNVQAANALLKTLEEPEGGAVFILLSSSRDSVLPTISSRARPVRFDPVPRAEVAAFLAARGVDNPDLAASLGRGSLGLSLRYAENESFAELRGLVLRAAASTGLDYEDRREIVESIVARAEAAGEAQERATLEELEDAEGNTSRAAKDRAKRIGRGARDLAARESIELLALVYRDAGVVGAGAEDLIVNADRVAEVREMVEANPGADWAGAALLLEEARRGLAYNVSAEATLEVALSRSRRSILGSYRDS